ncbi:large-conductance mechanosensitive channel protein MscL [Acetobacter sp. TBRC 12305]|uniref:Large-conductance mechanosensitive channel n=1 Tax=Acetobacter garciniae TaxID=2817435 RepID=A0A939HJT3_9PROT|nr:large-conductance mechanosensitive channel protein MscL [Acetobacter garciniae]MBO1324045.1 large-conductance mechanosensitive channel protein MscL [Acetobacter garciniae]MBX0343734.1 large-conductance mechanosensitive channel protein MscL [Acetobacter garciniae]
MAKPASRLHAPGWVTEFRKFIMRGNVVDLAVGVIIGAAFTAIVNSLVKDLFNPLLGLLIGGIDFSNLFITLKGPHLATLADAQKAGAVTLNVGLFLNAVLQFLIVAFAIFWMVKVLSSFHSRQEAQDAAEAPPPAPTKTEVLLEQIRDELATANKGATTDKA